MSAPAKLAAFAAALAVLFGGGALAGAAIGPGADETSEQTHGTAPEPQEHSDDIMDLLDSLDMDAIEYDPDGFQDRIRTISKQLKNGTEE